MTARTGWMAMSFLLLACGGSESTSTSGPQTVAGPDSPQPAGYTCGADAHCQSGSCIDVDSFRICGGSCVGGAACPSGTFCVEGESCLAPCATDADCAGMFDDSVGFYSGRATEGPECVVSEGYCWAKSD